MPMVIRNIAQLVAVPAGPLGGARFSSPPVIEDAALVIDEDRIRWFGPASQSPPGGGTTLDAGGGTVVPGLIDCHTHAVFAGSREGEFVRRIGGAGYLEIMQAGGGIRSTARAVRAASVEQLVEASLPRLRRMIGWGVTTLEIKSGYGLSPEDELKMLAAIRRVAEMSPVEIVPTFLGAHAVPEEYEGRPDDYLAAIADEALLARIAGERLAEFADVFCERGAFTIEQSRRYLAACKRHGLVPKVHADQITNCGATLLAVEIGAASADHLECIDDEGIKALKRTLQFNSTAMDNSSYPPAKPGAKGNAAMAVGGTSIGVTIPVLLPGCSFFLGTPPVPARRLIDAGLPVALATDCNPGSSMIESLPLVMSIACTMLRMTPLECLVACTANAAAALGRGDRLGAIAVGHQADLLILDVPNVERWLYQVGVNPVRTIIKSGRVIS